MLPVLSQVVAPCQTKSFLHNCFDRVRTAEEANVVVLQEVKELVISPTVNFMISPRTTSMQSVCCAHSPNRHILGVSILATIHTCTKAHQPIPSWHVHHQSDRSNHDWNSS